MHIKKFINSYENNVLIKIEKIKNEYINNDKLKLVSETHFLNKFNSDLIIEYPLINNKINVSKHTKLNLFVKPNMYHPYWQCSIKLNGPLQTLLIELYPESWI